MSAATPLSLDQLRVTRSEWIKASSLRSTWYTVAFIILGMVGIAAGVAWASIAFWDDLSASDQANFDAVGVALGGVILAQMVVAVLGVQIITGEYSSGMIRSSLAVVPRRAMLLIGKIAVTAVLSLVVSLVASFGAFFIGQMILGDQGVSIGSSSALRVVLGAAFNLTAIGILATSVGFMSRSTAAGISIILGILLVLPVLGAILPFDWFSDLMNYLPGSAGAAVMATTVNPGPISPLLGLITMSAWVVVFVAGAWIMLTRSDA